MQLLWLAQSILRQWNVCFWPKRRKTDLWKVYCTSTVITAFLNQMEPLMLTSAQHTWAILSIWHSPNLLHCSSSTGKLPFGVLSAYSVHMNISNFQCLLNFMTGQLCLALRKGTRAKAKFQHSLQWGNFCLQEQRHHSPAPHSLPMITVSLAGPQWKECRWIGIWRCGDVCSLTKFRLWSGSSLDCQYLRTIDNHSHLTTETAYKCNWHRLHCFVLFWPQPQSLQKHV